MEQWREQEIEMAKNIEELYNMMDARLSWIYEDPMELDKYREALVGYFENEEEVEEFIKTGDYGYVDALGEVYEEIIEKFPSDRLKYLFDKFVMTSYPDGVPTGPPKYDATLDEWLQ